MINEEYVKNLVDQSKGSGKTFAEFIATVFQDKFVEIYVGDAYEEVKTEQVSTAYPAVFCGKVLCAYRECLVINSAFVNSSKKLQLGKLMFISERAIRGLSEVTGTSTLQDMFLRCRDTLELEQKFNNEQNR